jgi:hypothetical protein
MGAFRLRVLQDFIFDFYDSVFRLVFNSVELLELKIGENISGGVDLGHLEHHQPLDVSEALPLILYLVFSRM